MAVDFHVGDFGQTIRYNLYKDDAAFDPAGLTGSLVFVKPSGTEVTAAASLTGSTAYYTIPAGLLDEAGAWRIELILSSVTQGLQGRDVITVRA